MQMVSLQAGSVVVTLRLTVRDPESPVGVSTLAPMLPRLLASTVFQIDPRGTFVQGEFSSTPKPAARAPQSPGHLQGESVRDIGIRILSSSPGPGSPPGSHVSLLQVGRGPQSPGSSLPEIGGNTGWVWAGGASRGRTLGADCGSGPSTSMAVPLAQTQSNVT